MLAVFGFETMLLRIVLLSEKLIISALKVNCKTDKRRAKGHTKSTLSLEDVCSWRI